MEQFFSQFGTYIAIATLVVAGGVALYGLWDKSSRERRKDVNEEEDRLITLLQETVKELEKKVVKQGQDIENLSKKVGDLEHENEILVKVLQGRDEQTKEFYKQAYESMKTTNETFKIVSKLAEGFAQSNANIEKLISIIGDQVKK